MDEHFERVMDLASQGRFEEARKYIQEADIPPQQKARYNMSLWSLENNNMTYTPPQTNVPKLPVISMILGFVLIITAFFLSGDAQTALIVIGLVMAAAIPAVYAFREKKQTDTEHDTRKEMAIRYTDGEADMNFPWQVPNARVVVTTIIGIVLLAVSVFLYDKTAKDQTIITSLVLAVAGCAVMTLSRALDNSFNGVIMWGTFAVSAVFISATAANAELFEGHVAVTAAFAIISALVLLLYPLWFTILKKMVCKEKVDAECVDIQTILGRKNYRPRYRAIWKYEYNGTTYIHRDMTSYKSPVYNERRIIGISPRYPHNIYTGKLPVYTFFISAAGIFILLFLLSFLMPLI